jgi:hypothetical protein
MRALPLALPSLAALSLGCDAPSPTPVTPDAADDTPAADAASDAAVDDLGADAPRPDVADVADVHAPDAPPAGSCTAARGAGTAATDRLVDGAAMTTVTVLDPGRVPAHLRPHLHAPRCATASPPTRGASPSGRASRPSAPATTSSTPSTRSPRRRRARTASAPSATGAFSDGAPIDCPPGGCFETGRLWTTCGRATPPTRSHLALAALDPTRARNSMEFKLSERRGGGGVQVVQDTGTGGSYPVSTDRVVWALGATELLKYLDGDARARFADRAFEALRNTVDHDRAVVYDAVDGLYRGEHSFLDWREQSYPGWTATDTRTSACRSRSPPTCSTTPPSTPWPASPPSAATRPRRRATGASPTRCAPPSARASGTPRRGSFAPSPPPGSTPRRCSAGTSSAPPSRCSPASPTRRRRAPRWRAYPHAGRGAAAVLWPQQQFTPIYHNRAMWPFVTAYWLRAARAVRNDAAVNRNVVGHGAGRRAQPLQHGEPRVAHGLPRVEEGPTSGPWSTRSASSGASRATSRWCTTWCSGRRPTTATAPLPPLLTRVAARHALRQRRLPRAQRRRVPGPHPHRRGEPPPARTADRGGRLRRRRRSA